MITNVLHLVYFFRQFINCLEKIEKASKHADFLGLEVHAGHGLTVESVALISRIKEIRELNIGHSIISDSIRFGLVNAVKRIKKAIMDARI